MPYVRSVSDVDAAFETVKELLQLRATKAGCPKLFVALDGLEELPDADRSGTLSAYKRFIDLIAGSGAEIVSGIQDSLRSHRKYRR